MTIPCIEGWWGKLLLSSGWNQTLWTPLNHIIFWFIFTWHHGMWACTSQGWTKRILPWSRWIGTWPCRQSCSWKSTRRVWYCWIQSASGTRLRMAWRRRWWWRMHLIAFLHQDENKGQACNMWTLTRSTNIKLHHIAKGSLVRDPPKYIQYGSSQSLTEHNINLTPEHNGHHDKNVIHVYNTGDSI